jgi:hypothetical protein
LRICSLYVLIIDVERINTSAVADAILRAPGWARVGITAPSPVLREDAALELARAIADAVSDAPREPLSEQSALPLWSGSH